MIKIYTASTAFEADQIQALLKDHGIPCIIKNDVSNVFTGASSIGYQDIYINEEDVSVAKELLEEVPIIKSEMPTVSTRKRLFARVLIIVIIVVGVAVFVLSEIM